MYVGEGVFDHFVKLPVALTGTKIPVLRKRSAPCRRTCTHVLPLRCPTPTPLSLTAFRCPKRGLSSVVRSATEINKNMPTDPKSGGRMLKRNVTGLQRHMFLASKSFSSVASVQEADCSTGRRPISVQQLFHVNSERKLILKAKGK